ncbi:GNAT family N-acetyltransferase [Alloalcanivorax gelatiniphagus]|uniref:GNAT family N-acetyltransferase n=1 Tax=Alloalcanivorax gelatiniphagus TaxID=1194167 RepID=UPI001F10F702|nr:GNAT family N-acetyltransferase [Alloalcanivorax gelatiniphagus]
MVEYKVNYVISPKQFIDVLNRSTLAERRPADDRECVEGMLRHGNLTVTAWDADKLIGIARSVTDFHYACYLSDLAVDVAYQHVGIGRGLIHRTQRELGTRCKIRLISAPAAMDYYPKLGFVRNQQCWELAPSATQADLGAAANTSAEPTG